MWTRPPPPPRFYRETPTETKEGLWRLRLNAGLIVRQDIPFEAPVVQLKVSQTLRIETGPVTLKKSVAVLANGRLQVQLELTITEPLANLKLNDTLPTGIETMSDFRLADEAAPISFRDTKEGLELTNIPAGFTASFAYDLDFNGQPESLLLAPRITWEQP